MHTHEFNSHCQVSNPLLRSSANFSEVASHLCPITHRITSSHQLPNTNLLVSSMAPSNSCFTSNHGLNRQASTSPVRHQLSPHQQSAIQVFLLPATSQQSRFPVNCSYTQCRFMAASRHQCFAATCHLSASRQASARLIVLARPALAEDFGSTRLLS